MLVSSAVNTPDPEKPFLQLLRDLKDELEVAIESLSSKPVQFQETYQLALGKYMLAIADGFLLLREFSRGDVSKMAIRPAIEIMIRMQAVRRDPAIFFRIAYTDTSEDQRWLRLASESDGSKLDLSQSDADWARFNDAFAKTFPEITLTEKTVNLFELATVAKLDRWYNSHYRLYSQATHGTLRAAQGLSFTDTEDHYAMHLCVFGALEALVSVGATAPQLDSFKKRLSDIRDSHDRD